MIGHTYLKLYLSGMFVYLKYINTPAVDLKKMWEDLE